MSTFRRSILLFGIPLVHLVQVLGSEDSPETIVKSALSTGYLLIGFFAGLGVLVLLEAVWMVKALPRMALTDISHDPRPFPKSAEPFLPMLTQFGFRPLGQGLSKRPGRSARVTWVLTRADGYVTAEISESKQQKPIIEFDTVFDDLAMLTTEIPKGTPITLPNYRCITGFTGLVGMQEAYQVHQEVASDMMQAHGRPIAVKTMEDFLKQARVFPQQHSLALTKAVRRRVFLEMLPFFYLAIWILLLTALLFALDGYKPVVGYLMGLLILPVGASLLMPVEERVW